MRDVVIDLIKETPQVDQYGVQRMTETARTVFARRDSVTRNEFFGGGRNGLNPEAMFLVFAGDYEGERKCAYNGLTYAIYRTYETDDDYIELYVQREGGTNGIRN